MAARTSDSYPAHRTPLPALLLAVLAAIVAAAAVVAPRSAAAQDPDIIRGSVTGPGGQPVTQAQIAVTSLAAQTTRTGRTDDRGRFTILFANGGGDYLVRITAIGLRPFETRVQRIDDDPVLLVAAQLELMIVELDPVRVQAPRARVRQNAVGAPDVGGSETRVGRGTTLPPSEQGNLAALAATLLGVTLVPGVDGAPAGFSVLGLGAEQNSVTMNGMQFDPGNLPRDAAVVTSLATTTFDASRGGFSGGQLSVRSLPATNFVQRTLSFSLEHPALQWSDPSAGRFGQEYRNYQLGGSFSGPLVRDKAFYNVSAQLGRRSSDLQSILGADAVSLQRMGLAPDSLTRFLGVLDALGIPATLGGIPSSQRADNGSLMARVDLAPSGQRTLNFMATGSWSRSDGMGISPGTLPARGSGSRGWNGALQGNFSTYVNNFLNETRLGVTRRASESAPYLSLPSGSVRISSVLPDNTTGITTLAFGGSGSLARSSRSQGVELGNTTSWFSLDSRHRLKLAGELRYDSYVQDESSGQLGTFTYNSLADLEAGQPASFSRSLTPRVRDGDALNLALSLGDEWRPSRRNSSFRVQYGLRLEGTRFGATPRYNPEVQRLFGLRTSDVPNAVAVSPRVGFNWSYGAANRLGGPFNEGPRGSISGGIGRFRNALSSSLLSQAVENTGLPDASQFLNCLGPAAPAPEWRDYGADLGTLPAECADGTGGTAFVERQPRVFVFDPAYEAQSSWRGNIAWSGRLTPRLRLSSELLQSFDTHQPGAFDANFAGVERFRLAGEGNRPVFVDPASIVPATGGIALASSRRFDEYTQVNVQRSDLHSRSTRLSFNLSPQGRFNSSFGWGAGYALSWNATEERGFGGTTVGDPRQREWGRGGGARHQLNLNAYYSIHGAVSVSMSSRVSSGRRYTPRVGGDANGDGLANDRAFVFDPDDPATAAADPEAAAAMTTLLADASSRVRSCLREQLGTLARRNSCTGPWTMGMNMQVGIVPGSFGLPPRTSISFSLANPLPMVDELLHGRRGLRGWGQEPMGDPTLLYVRGFDAERQRFVYQVNPRFGDTRPSSAVSRAPFRLSVEVRTGFGPTPEQQTLDRQLSMGRSRDGSKMTAAMFQQQFTFAAAGPIMTILRPGVRDSLHLTAAQVDTLTAIQRRHMAAVEAVYAPVSEYLAGLGKRYDAGEAASRVREARERATELTMSVTRRVREVLTAEQLNQLPSFMQVQFDERLMRRMRRAGGDPAGVGFRF